MRYPWILLMLLLVVGCTTPLPIAVQDPLPAPPAVMAAADPTKVVETRHEVRGYREVNTPALRHEAHAVYRRTRVPITATDDLMVAPRASYPPPSYEPLAASDELAAELATQRKLSTDLRAVQASLVETEQKMQAQYVILVRQSAEISKVREGLEAERGRLRVAPAPTPAARPAPARAPAADPAPAKW
jgi:hypothetical protein